MVQNKFNTYSKVSSTIYCMWGKTNILWICRIFIRIHSYSLGIRMKIIYKMPDNVINMHTGPSTSPCLCPITAPTSPSDLLHSQSGARSAGSLSAQLLWQRSGRVRGQPAVRVLQGPVSGPSPYQKTTTNALPQTAASERWNTPRMVRRGGVSPSFFMITPSTLFQNNLFRPSTYWILF